MANITMLGAGYIGLVTGACFADRGNHVTCVDKNPTVIKGLNNGKIHIFEPGLEDIVKKNIAQGRMHFTQDLQESTKDSEFIFIGVNTPSNDTGEFNLDYFFNACEDVGRAIRDTENKIIVGKSTVPQGTYKEAERIIEQAAGHNNWSYVSNPETLAEGRAVADFSKPDRIIIGTNSDEAFQKMKELYHPFNVLNDRVLRGSPADAELAKLFSNTALATRIAMVNEFARIADVTENADMDLIRRMVCEDTRIGHQFMFPSPGYGGSCFPKDIQGLTRQAEKDGYNPLLLSKIHESNETHKEYIGERVSSLLEDNPRIGVWGVTFKPNTDDMRDAASIPILTGLINRGAEVVAYDPQDSRAREIFKDKVRFVDNQYEAIQDVDALLLLTEWSQFDSPNYQTLKESMRGNTLLDMRNRWLPQEANSQGFNYFGVGRHYPL